MSFRNHKKILKNKKMYEYFIDEYSYPVALALIMTGNGEMISDLKIEEINKANQVLLEMNKESLFDQALLYGDYDAIKHILNSEIEIPADDHFIKRYLKELFVRFGDIIFVDDKCNSFNKSKENITRIFNLIRYNLAVNSKIWTDNTFMNSLAPLTTSGEVITLDALLELGLLTEFNFTDDTGKTALFYLKTMNPNSKLISILKERGAVLSEADLLAIEQINISNKFSKAVLENNTDVIEACLKEFSDNEMSLTKEQYLECLNLVIAENHVETVIAMLNTKYAENLNLIFIKHRNASLDMQYVVATHLYTNPISSTSFSDKLKRYSHQIGLQGSVTGRHFNERKVYKLEGSENNSNTISALLNSLHSYCKEKPEFKYYYDAINFEYNVNALYQYTTNSDLPLKFHRYSDGGHVVLRAGWFKHRIGMGIKYDAKTDTTYIAISNRGRGALNILANIPDSSKFGTAIYKYPGKLDISFLENFNSSSDKFTSSNQFKDAFCPYIEDASLVAILPAKAQGKGTCSYVNPKRTIEGFLVIDAICERKHVDQKLLDEKYNQYKLFSIYDKINACNNLIDHYNSTIIDVNANPVEIDALKQLITQVIIQHHSFKNDRSELEIAKKLYSLLPTEYQKKLAVIVPEVITNQPALFARQRGLNRDIKILGELEYILQYTKTVENLMEYFIKNDISCKQIKSIEVNKENIKITTSENRNIKTQIRDNHFAKKLHAEIDNVPGRYEFYVTNPMELTFQENPIKHKPGGIS